MIGLVSLLLLGACAGSSGNSPLDDTASATSTTHTMEGSTTSATTTTRPEEASTSTSTTVQVSAPTSQPVASTNEQESPQGDEVELELSVFDLTENNAPAEGAYIVVDVLHLWVPNLEFGGDLRSFGNYPIGVPTTIWVYPDGADGNQVEVIFTMNGDMISGSDRATTHIEIYDSTVVAWGEAIPAFEQSFTR